jgi:hypothetical protein
MRFKIGLIGFKNLSLMKVNQLSQHNSHFIFIIIGDGIIVRIINLPEFIKNTLKLNREICDARVAVY